jgi:uncharacterized protein YjbK
MKNAYSCTLILKHPSRDGLIYSSFVVAEDEERAKQRVRENLSEGEFLSDTRDWTIETETYAVIGEEHIEEAAIEVLGWGPPA